MMANKNNEQEDDFVSPLLSWYEKEKENTKQIEITENKANNRKKLYPVLFEKESVIELGRLTFKNSGVSVYLPKRICKKLMLDKEKHSSLIIVASDNNSFVLIKDTEMINILRSKIIEARKSLQKGY